MGAAAGPDIVEDGLILSLDAASSKSYKKDNNLLNPKEWTTGTGSTATFNRNGRSDENVRIIDTDPFGNRTTIWECRPNDSSSNSDGGWNTDTVSVDENFLYRFSVWAKRDVLGDGHLYLGTDGYDNSSEIGVLRRSSGSSTTNPYFEVNTDWNDWSENKLNKWYLVIGHIWPSGSGTGSDHPDTGVYDLSGNKISNDPADFVWKVGTTRTRHRCYLYYSAVNTTRQQMVYPRIDKVDGSEPSVKDLIENNVNDIYWYDVSGNNNHGVNYNMTITNDAGGSFSFNDSTSVSRIRNSSTLNPLTELSIEAWVIFDTNSNDFIFEKGDVNTQYSLFSHGNDVVFRTFHEGEGSYDSLDITKDSLDVSNGKWTHIVGSWDGSVKRFYINGEFKASKNQTGNLKIRNTDAAVGRFGGTSTGYYFGGEISKISIYNKGLKESEIQQNFNALRGRYGI